VMEIDIAEILRKSSSKEWNAALSSRLELMYAYLGREEWSEGVSVFLRAVVGNQIKKFMAEGGNAEYVRGFYACAELILALPISVAKAMAKEESPKPQGPQGDAGY
jgi:hypothetical protein